MARPHTPPKLQPHDGYDSDPRNQSRVCAATGPEQSELGEHQVPYFLASACSSEQTRKSKICSPIPSNKMPLF